MNAAERKQLAYDSLDRSMLAMQLAVNNVLDKDMSKIGTGGRPAGVRQVSVLFICVQL